MCASHFKIHFTPSKAHLNILVNINPRVGWGWEGGSSSKQRSLRLMKLKINIFILMQIDCIAYCHFIVIFLFFGMLVDTYFVGSKNIIK